MLFLRYDQVFIVVSGFLLFGWESYIAWGRVISLNEPLSLLFMSMLLKILKSLTLHYGDMVHSLGFEWRNYSLANIPIMELLCQTDIPSLKPKHRMPFSKFSYLIFSSFLKNKIFFLFSPWHFPFTQVAY